MYHGGSGGMIPIGKSASTTAFIIIDQVSIWKKNGKNSKTGVISMIFKRRVSIRN